MEAEACASSDSQLKFIQKPPKLVRANKKLSSDANERRKSQRRIRARSLSMCEITLSTNAHHDDKITEVKFQGHISALICRRNELTGKSLLDLLPIKAWKYN